MSQNKADETFQESVQALANWLIFLEEKKNTYNRQLERAISAQNVRGEDALPVTAEMPGNGHGTAENHPVGKAETGTSDEVLYDAWDISGEADPAPLASAGIRLDTWDAPGNGQAESSPLSALASEMPGNGGGTIALDDAWLLDEGNDASLDEFPDWLTGNPAEAETGARSSAASHSSLPSIDAEEIVSGAPSENGPGDSRLPDGGTTEEDNELDPWL